MNKDFYKILLSFKSEAELEKFLKDLLTKQELKAILNRWSIVKMLNKQTPYEDITKATKISSTTIAKVSNRLKNGTGGFGLAVKKLVTKS